MTQKYLNTLQSKELDQTRFIVRLLLQPYESVAQA